MVNILGPELLQIADSAAREKGIDRDEVIVAVEQAIQRAGRSKYGLEHDIRASIDRKTGEIRLARYREVVEDGAEIEDEFAQMTLTHAQRYNASAKVGDMLVDDLPPIDFGRVAAQSCEAGHRPESARSRARPAVSGVRRTGRRDRQRPWSSATSSAMWSLISARPRRFFAETRSFRASIRAAMSASGP